MLRSLKDIKKFEIKPRVIGDTIVVTLEDLKKSKVVLEQVEAIRKQHKNE